MNSAITLRGAGEAFAPLWQGAQAASSAAFILRGAAALLCDPWQLEHALAATRAVRSEQPPSPGPCWSPWRAIRWSSPPAHSAACAKDRGTPGRSRRWRSIASGTWEPPDRYSARADRGTWCIPPCPPPVSRQDPCWRPDAEQRGRERAVIYRRHAHRMAVGQVRAEYVGSGHRPGGGDQTFRDRQPDRDRSVVAAQAQLRRPDARRLRARPTSAACRWCRSATTACGPTTA